MNQDVADIDIWKNKCDQTFFQMGLKLLNFDTQMIQNCECFQTLLFQKLY